MSMSVNMQIYDTAISSEMAPVVSQAIIIVNEKWLTKINIITTKY